MDWKGIGQKVAGAAPLLGAALGGPGGAALGSLVASALGSASDPASVERVLLGSGDALAKLREVESNNALELQRLVIQAEATRQVQEAAQYAAEAADRHSAREFAAKQPADLIRPAITIVMLVGSLLIAAAVVLGWAKEVMSDATMSLTLGTVIGFWFNELKQVMGFYFGMTKDASVQSRVITDFAVAPGSVTGPEK